MKSLIWIPVSLLFLAACQSASKQRQKEETPLAVIFDTDIGNDIDDVLALQMLFDYEKQQKVKLLGITISKSNPRVIDYIDGYCRLNGHNDMPLGYAYNGVNPEAGKYVPATLDTTVNGKKLLFPKRSIQTAASSAGSSSRSVGSAGSSRPRNQCSPPAAVNRRRIQSTQWCGAGKEKSKTRIRHGWRIYQ
jgi:hypothetical protein